MALNTEYAKSGLYRNRHRHRLWSLVAATPGSDVNEASFVNDVGYVSRDDFDVDYSYYAVRPLLS
jgi:hypothetical protein